MGAPIADPRPTIPTQPKRCLSARRGQSTADGGACRVRKRAIWGCSKRSRQQPWRRNRWQSDERRIRRVRGRSQSMELGIYHEFPVLPGRSQAECFAAGFDIVDASEEYGLDVMWLPATHFDKRRALAASPLVLGTAIAARTERIRIGTSVQVLPLANPLRIAEEAATLDHVSKGREIECLEIIQRAWREDNFSYKGKFYDIQDVTVVPQPLQQPMPEIRIAAVSVETFPAAGKAGQGLFLSVRHEDVRMFKQHIDVYRKAWTDAGHPGEAPVYLRCPGFVAKTDAAAHEAYGPTLMRHFQNQSRLLADSSRRQNSPPDHPRWKTSQRLTEITLEETLRGSVFIGSPDTVVGKLKDLQRDIGLSGVQLETNCAGLAAHAAEREAIRLLAREVKSAFR